MASAYAGGMPVGDLTGTPSGSVYVVKVGAVYVVIDAAITMGEWLVRMVIDDQGKILARSSS